MFFGLSWYGWLAIVTVLMISVFLKLKFIKWWNKRQQEQKNQRGQWGDDE